MEIVTRLSQNMQTFVPAVIQREYGLKPKEELVWEMVNGYIKVQRRKKRETILDLVGKFRPKKNKNKSVLEAREAMEKNYSRF
jgi:bifunctional DNA-binding transcriptional regulator/antitoxin component of YhaV-PrlF toxin-antitoxin module